MLNIKDNKYLNVESEAIQAIFLLGTLKPESELSHTEALSELLIENLKPYNVKSEIIRLVEYDIKPGTKNDMGNGDQWPGILEKLLKSDIIIFATPIWWGIHSSIIQRVIERMDELNDQLLETGKSELANKIGGIVISGAEDGAEHIIGNLSNFMVWNGISLPPACSLSFLGNYEKTKESLLEKFRKQKSTSGMARTMARNLVFFARLLKENNIPQAEDGGIIQDIIPGSVGMRGNKE